MSDIYWAITPVAGVDALVASDCDKVIVWLGFISETFSQDQLIISMKQDIGADLIYEQKESYIQDALEEGSLRIRFIGGSDFQLSVWSVLLSLKEGEVVSYCDVAEKLGKPKAIRAVASAIGRNFISYFVPCHRVIRKDGSYHGYRWGDQIKKMLLEREQH